MKFFTIESAPGVPARIGSEDAADHVVTATLDQAVGPWLIHLAAPGARGVVTTPSECIEVVIVSTDLEHNTVTFTIGEPS